MMSNTFVIPTVINKDGPLIVIPALVDGNEPFNAFAIGLFSLFETCNFLLSQSNDHSLAGKIKARLDGYVTISKDKIDKNTKNKAFISLQKQLASDLREHAAELLEKNNEVANIFYKVFKHAFLKYCAGQFNIPFTKVMKEKKSAELLVSVTALQSYIDIFLKIFTSKINSNSNHIFEKIFNELFKEKYFAGVMAYSQLEKIVENTHVPQQSEKNSLKNYWQEAYKQYTKAIQTGIFAGDMELLLLAKELGIKLSIKHKEDESKLNHASYYNYYELTLKNQWGLVLEVNRVIGLLKTYYKKIKRCYQFLDKLFDDGIYVVNTMGFTYNLNLGYVPWEEKKNFSSCFASSFVMSNPSFMVGAGYVTG